jgi:hypothetical protein
MEGSGGKPAARIRFAMLPSFFIVGCGRSGTTLLRNVLCSHPEVLIPPETSFFFWHRVNDASRPLSDAECKRLLPELRLDRTSRLRPDHFLRRELVFLGTDWERFLAEVRGRPPERRRPVDVFEALIDDWVRRQDKRVSMVGEKTPHHVFAMRRILRNMPKARFIHMVRDPRAVVPSLLEMPWFKGGTAAAALRWRNSVEAVRTQQGNLAPDRFLEVRYEDLVQDLPGMARRLAGFLGLAFDERMLEPERHGARYVEAQAWHGMSRTAVAKGVNDRRKSSLDPVQRRVVEMVAGELLEVYGYPPPTGSDAATERKAERIVRRERLVASISPRGFLYRAVSRVQRLFG